MPEVYLNRGRRPQAPEQLVDAHLGAEAEG